LSPRGIIIVVDHRAVARNRDRFPEDFVCQLTAEELGNLRFQIGTSNQRGGRRYRPYAFTQEGIAMLSSVLRSPRAVAVNIEIMRAFIRMRGMLVSVDELARKLETLERKAVAHDKDLESVFQALRELMTPPDKPTREIGFHAAPEPTSPAAKRRKNREL